MTPVTDSSIRKILVPVDFSPSSLKVVRFAGSIARLFNSEIIIFHVNESPAVMAAEPLVSLDFTYIEAEINKELEKIKDMLSSEFQLSKVRTHSIPGYTVNEIKSETEDENADLVVMGSISKSDVSLLSASVASGVTSKVDCPVLIIPDNTVFRAPARVLFITNYHENEIAPLLFLISLLAPFKSELIILHVGDHDKKSLPEKSVDEYNKKIFDRLSYPGIKFQNADVESLEKNGEEFIKANGIDWISFTSKKRSLFDKLTSRNIVRDILLRSTIPMLSFHVED